MIRIVFACDGAAGRERLHECDSREVYYPEGCGAVAMPEAVNHLKKLGWTLDRFGKRFIVRCPKCQELRVKRNAARAQRDRLREARAR